LWDDVFGSKACHVKSRTCCSISGPAWGEQAVSARARQIIEMKMCKCNRIFLLSRDAIATALANGLADRAAAGCHEN
jgi:hypothetical protein